MRDTRLKRCKLVNSQSLSPETYFLQQGTTPKPSKIASHLGDQILKFQRQRGPFTETTTLTSWLMIPTTIINYFLINIGLGGPHPLWVVLPLDR